MSKPPVIKKRVSSGGVIFRRNTGNIEVALVLVRGNRAWCLPKGLIEKGEDEPAAALREVREETGLQGEVLNKLGMISYWYFIEKEMVRIHKTVHFFLMNYLKGRTEDHDHEVDEAQWISIDEAISRLSYKSERDIVLKAKKMIETRRKPSS